jgi:hypothetical protein
MERLASNVPEAKATEESLVQAGKKISVDLTQQKNRAWLWKRKILHRPMECEITTFALLIAM